MGMPGVPELLIITAILLLIFGTKRIRTLGQDMGQAIRGFRQGFEELEETQEVLKQEARHERSSRAQDHETSRA